MIACKSVLLSRLGYVHTAATTDVNATTNATTSATNACMRHYNQRYFNFNFYTITTDLLSHTLRLTSPSHLILATSSHHTLLLYSRGMSLPFSTLVLHINQRLSCTHTTSPCSIDIAQALHNSHNSTQHTEIEHSTHRQTEHNTALHSTADTASQGMAEGCDVPAAREFAIAICAAAADISLLGPAILPSAGQAEGQRRGERTRWRGREEKGVKECGGIY